MSCFSIPHLSCPIIKWGYLHPLCEGVPGDEVKHVDMESHLHGDREAAGYVSSSSPLTQAQNLPLWLIPSEGQGSA